MMKKNPAQLPPYFQVVTVPNAPECDVLLYGAIGQMDWWSEDGEETLTDLEFVKTIKELEKTYSRINIRINSPGGSTYHGFAIIAAMRACKAQIHTYVDGMAASMAGMIWLAGNVRHVNPGSLVMIHDIRMYMWDYFNAYALRKMADTIDKLNQSAIASLSSFTGLDAAEITTKYFDGEDHWLTAADCQEAGFVPSIEDYKIENSAVPKDATSMSVKDLMQFYMQTDDQNQPDGLSRLIEGIRSKFNAVIKSAPIISPKKSPDMNLEELKAALKDGSIDAAAVQLLLDDQKPVATPPAVAVEKPVETPEGDDPLKAKIDSLEAKIANLEAENKKLGEKPGAQMTVVTPDAQQIALSPEKLQAKKELDAYNLELGALADRHLPAGFQTEL